MSSLAPLPLATALTGHTDLSARQAAGLAHDVTHRVARNIKVMATGQPFIYLVQPHAIAYAREATVSIFCKVALPVRAHVGSSDVPLCVCAVVGQARHGPFRGGRVQGVP